MPLIFKKVQRGKPGDPDNKKWYVTLKRLSIARIKEIAKLATADTTLNPKEVEYSLSLSLKAVPQVLKEGRSAQLGDLGTFFLTVTSAPADTPEGVTARNVKKINIRFRPSAEFQAEIDKAELIAADHI